MNGTAHYSSQILPPRAHGSGAAPLAELLMNGHGGRIPSVTRAERDLLMAWIDSNGLYHGTWNSTQNGSAVKAWQGVRDQLMGEMRAAGCTMCHGGNGKQIVFEDDWFNLQRPEFSRILRAPLPKGADGFGLGLCRERAAGQGPQRIRLLVEGYAHAVKPLDQFPRQSLEPLDAGGEAIVTFESPADATYQRMLAIIQSGREAALRSPRVDMPGAKLIFGQCRAPTEPRFVATPP